MSAVASTAVTKNSQSCLAGHFLTNCNKNKIGRQFDNEDDDDDDNYYCDDCHVEN